MNTNLNFRPGKKIALRSRKIITLFALLFAVSLSSFARPADGISSTVKASFTKDFKDARIISYDISRNLTKVTFSMNDLVLSAFYADNGELLAISRNVMISELPLSLMLSITQDYKNFRITGMFEMKGSEEHAYYLTMENASTKLALRSVDNSSWEVYSKHKKD